MYFKKKTYEWKKVTNSLYFQRYLRTVNRKFPKYLNIKFIIKKKFYKKIEGNLDWKNQII